MLRATQLGLQGEIATRFGLTEVATMYGTSTYRDILWVPSTVAPRARAEQSSKLGLDPESIFPFISFWRTGWRGNMKRLNTTLTQTGASTSDALTKKYTMRPLDLAFQIEYWTDKPAEFEAAIRNWYRWKMPGNVLMLTDTDDVTFELALAHGDAQDNSQLNEQYSIGKINRATFPLAVGSYVIESGGTFKTIQTIYWSVNDYSATGEIEDAVLIKEGTIT